MGFLDSVGDGLEGLYKDGKKAVGQAIDQNAHALGGMLDFVGLHEAAHAVDKFGDKVADNLGAQVGELQLGDTDDPKELVHGDVKAITESAKHLRAFHDAFEETGSGLRSMDSEHWQGQAADAFRAKFAPHPTQWLVTADACATAAGALDDFSHTVGWAQDQAKQAIDAYNAAKKAHQQAQDAYNASVDSYNKAVKTWNYAAKTNPNPGPQPTDPGAFHDPSTDQLSHAQDLLRAARSARDTAADAAAKAIKAATDAAPAEPSFTERMKLDAVDLAEGGMDGYEHLYGGVVKGAADILKFGRGLNPLDVYNITHPALYLDHVNTVAAGLVNVSNHPTQLLSAVVGSGWGSDPFEASGKLFTNVAFGIATGGTGEAASVATDVGVNASKDIAENAAEKTAIQSVENAGGDAAATAGANPAGLPDGWTIKDPLAGGVDRPLSPEDFRKLTPEQQMEVARSEISPGARTFKNNLEAGDYGADYWNGYADSMPQPLKDAVRDYTRGRPEDGRPTYRDMNGYLRSSDGSGGTPQVLQHIDKVDQALAGRPVPEDVLVARGTGLGHIDGDPFRMVGKEFTEDAFTSSSLGGPAGAFAGDDAILHLRVPEGTPGLFVEKVSMFGGGERELLLGKGLTWRATRVVNLNGQWQIFGEVLPK
ncbi:putative T7SS-secreted protein [Kitasatospora azatica]|uniref:putative T7SS-secreted protein n=1 Tax=Kitasatospora azatica TaxID=58347 RepID=UPI00055CB230|nr:ADP-ribosyltransferase [Kitasatospora azatica]